MRQIKFRVWVKPWKWMDFPTSISIDDSGHIEGVRGYGGDYPDTDMELMQYTGLHDKNGREIYDGDLFEHRFGYMVFDDAIHDEMGIEYGVVVLEDGQFGVKIPALGVYNLYGLLLHDGHLDDMPKDDLFVMKISGNVHDNPELLEASK